MKRLLCLLALIAFAATAMGCPAPRRHAPPPPGQGAPGQFPPPPGQGAPGQFPHPPGQGAPEQFSPPVAHP
jgi:hypothetical protein